MDEVVKTVERLELGTGYVEMARDWVGMFGLGLDLRRSFGSRHNCVRACRGLYVQEVCHFILENKRTTSRSH